MSYPRCSFKSVLELALSYGGQTAADLSTDQVALLNGYINNRLKTWAWIGWPWPETTPCEIRHYRATYAAGTAYAAPTPTAATEVYFPAARQYYQALRACTGQAPATLVGTTWTVNADYWAVCSGPYNAPDFVAGTAYTVGTQVRDPADGLFKQCHTAHTAGASLDGTKFGILTVFDPYVAKNQDWEENVMGEVLGVFLDNPKLEPRPRRIHYRMDALGAHILTTPYSRYGRGLGVDYLVPHQVYVLFRLPCPEFRGAAFAEDATYSAGTDVIYFEGETTDLEGDYWACAEDTSAGESPATAPAKWTRLEFPEWLRDCVARRAAADWQRHGGNREAAAGEDAAGDDALYQAQLRAGDQQRQTLYAHQSTP